MENNRDFQLIEQYLGNELSESEKLVFDQRLQVEEELAGEFEKRQTAHKALDFMVAQNLKEQLKSLEEDHKVISIQRRRRKMIYILSAAASVLLLIGAFTIFFPGRSTPAELAAVYYEQPDFSSRRSTTSPEAQPTMLSSGTEALENSDYEQAITILGSIPESDENYLIATYYLAHAYYLSSQFREAEAGFTTVSESNEIRYREQAEWYALLACLSQEAECNILLKNIKDHTAHPYHKEAVKIDRRLK